MRPTYNKSKIMRNAWYLKRVTSLSFAACLRKAWLNEKQAILTAMIEGRPMESGCGSQDLASSAAFKAGCLAYYQNAPRGTYFGD